MNKIIGVSVVSSFFIALAAVVGRSLIQGLAAYEIALISVPYPVFTSVMAVLQGSARASAVVASGFFPVIVGGILLFYLFALSKQHKQRWRRAAIEGIIDA